mmetsp:Transcript_15870/g.46955  ORF Transcript_15870/g.46955 Transcript_15870/m.46955 type:complete len:234 (-) Transcript_15870:126-827(-)
MRPAMLGGCQRSPGLAGGAPGAPGAAALSPRPRPAVKPRPRPARSTGSGGGMPGLRHRSAGPRSSSRSPSAAQRPAGFTASAIGASGSTPGKISRRSSSESPPEAHLSSGRPVPMNLPPGAAEPHEVVPSAHLSRSRRPGLSRSSSRQRPPPPAAPALGGGIHLSPALVAVLFDSQSCLLAGAGCKVGACALGGGAQSPMRELLGDGSGGPANEFVLPSFHCGDSDISGGMSI